MARRTYRVVLEVLSNMDGDPPEGAEEKLIKGYLESLGGIGNITVLEVERAGRPVSHSLSTSLAVSPSWTPEAPTKTRKKKR